MNYFLLYWSETVMLLLMFYYLNMLLRLVLWTADSRHRCYYCHWLVLNIYHHKALIYLVLL